ncbi:MAG: metal-dependent hydrolase family protein [Planctomycetota bacterium]|jgi:imidazolonepropionase-like amidohydrolase
MRMRLIAAALLLVALVMVRAEQSPAEGIVFRNARIFDGKTNALSEPMNVLVVGNRIAKISEDALPGATEIDCGGRTLMPGLIDAHVHISINKNFDKVEADLTPADIAIRSLVAARGFLDDGFTTIRDVGGSVFATKRAIDGGLFPGPRIYPSGAFISQTSGHGDFRASNDPNPTLAGTRTDVSNFSRMGISMVVDGRDRVLAAVRQNLMQGATQIKIMAGGGGSSKYDPIDTTGFTLDEMRAAVEAAEDWGTYVCAHIFTPRAIRRALKAGVKCLEHGFFMDEETIRLCAETGTFVCPQTWGMSPELMKNPMMPKYKLPGIKALQKRYENFPKWLLKHKVKVAFATDWVGEIEDADKSRRYELHWRCEYFGSNFEVLKQATSVAGELMALSGKRNPYPGKLGVIEEGALADILVVEGNPLEDITVLGGHPEWYSAPTPTEIKTLRVIMKDGAFHKNTLR